MIHSLEAQLNPANPASVGRRYQSAIPICRYVTPDEIANPVLFLCSDLASAITRRNTLSTAHAPPPAVR
jgi:enoyl-[acyl-carrier-protein] reductase (NADH)